MLPIVAALHDSLSGLVVLGVGPRRVLDGAYRTFFDLIASHIGSAISDAKVYEVQRQQAEEALRQSEERFRHYFELGLIGMAITSPTKGLLEVNDAICKILGYGRGELLRMTWAELTYPDELAVDVVQFNRVMAGEIDGYSMDKRWIRKDGQVIDATIEAGAVAFLQKPFGEQDLFNAIQSAWSTYRSSTALVIHDEPLTFQKDSDMVTTNRDDEARERPQGESRAGAARSEIEQPIRFAGSQLGAKRHICGFFTSADEEYRLLLPFIKEGFDRGEKAFHVVDPKLHAEHTRRLESVGIDVTEAEKRGQLELCNWNEAYFPDGRFDQNRMLAMWREVLDGATQRGFLQTRLVAHIEWSLEEREGVSDLLEYEARFNLVHQNDRDPVICTYDLTRFKADVIMNVMRTHPMIIIGGILQENPFFVPPDEFVRELRERQAIHKMT